MRTQNPVGATLWGFESPLRHHLPFRKILEKAKDEGVDMIVISTHGRTGVLHLRIGGVTEQVVRRATSPVLYIRPETKE